MYRKRASSACCAAALAASSIHRKMATDEMAEPPEKGGEACRVFVASPWGYNRDMLTATDGA